MLQSLAKDISARLIQKLDKLVKCDKIQEDWLKSTRKALLELDKRAFEMNEPNLTEWVNTRLPNIEVQLDLLIAYYG